MNTGGAHIVKCGGRRTAETFTPEKLAKSIVAACTSAGAHTGQAETISQKVVEEVQQWLEDKPEVTSDDLRRVAAKHLSRYHPDAGYLYEQHRMTI